MHKMMVKIGIKIGINQRNNLEPDKMWGFWCQKTEGLLTKAAH